MSKKITTSDINDWLLEDGRGIKIVDEYVDAKTKILFKCNNDDHPSWLATPNNIKNGKGCPRCSGTHSPTTEEMNNWLLEDGRGIKIVDEYVNDRTKIQFKCSNENHLSWYATPNNIKRGKGCPQCSPTAKKQQRTSLNG